MTVSNKKKKSPLTAQPLHNPGQSLDDEINRLVVDKLFFYALLVVLPIVLALMEWWRWYMNLPPNPVIYALIATVVSPVSFFKLTRLRKQLLSLRLGRDGEKAVGQYLEDLRGKGYRVLHDISGDNFNVDHVVLAQNGIFVVETKTISKPQKGEAKISVTDDNILVNGIPMDRNPLVQAKAAASWIADLLKQSTGKAFPVKPVVVFPGWYVEGKQKDVWVVNPKGLPTFIENERLVLRPDDVQLATYHLTRYIRAQK